MKLNNIVFLVFSYQTENKEKIKHAIDSLLCEYIKEATVDEQKIDGHYGDSIVEIKYIFKGKVCSKILDNLLSRFDKADIIYLLSTLDSRVEKSKVHLRLDKQLLIAKNKLSIKDGDDIIKIIISTGGRVKEFKEELKQFVNRDMHKES
jgi:RNA binding exosome subunit